MCHAKAGIIEFADNFMLFEKTAFLSAAMFALLAPGTQKPLSRSISQ